MTAEGEVHNLTTDYYKTLFTSHMGGRYDEVLQHVPRRITHEMNQALTREFTDAEIKQALDSIGDLKAPGEDGMPALFYKQYW